MLLVIKLSVNAMSRAGVEKRCEEDQGPVRCYLFMLPSFQL